MALEWVTTSQAARALGISDRQARRYAARLGHDDRQEADAMTGHATGSRPARVRFEALKALRATAKGEVLSVEVADMTPDMEANTRPAPGGHDDRPVSAMASASRPLETPREAELKEEVRFLRATIEQHQRSEAELRASLREALKAMPKQLTQGAAESAPGREISGAKVEGEQSDAVRSNGAQNAPESDGPTTYGDIADWLEGLEL